VVIFRDITTSQKLERAKDDFLAVAAHELRSPLAAVRGYADLLLRRSAKREEDPAEVRGLTILGQQVTHMLRLVDNLLDVSRLDADQLNLARQKVNLVSLAQQVIEQQRPVAGERELLLDSEELELNVDCDQLRIRQVLTNLIGNAVRYSPNGTTVSVRLRTEHTVLLAQRYPGYLRAAAQGERPESELVALVQVQDQGGGIAEEQVGRLFKRYSRGIQRAGEGLGLGLYLSREFVTRHGGAIWVESREGQGSTFMFTLPLGEESGNGVEY
jgi:two-component system phosphate regulon sensor histidine kinase PhoR